MSRLTDLQRLAECFTCALCDTCEYDDAIEDENGSCTAWQPQVKEQEHGSSNMDNSNM